MSNIEKRKPFSPVDGKRLLQQHNRPSKGHRRGKVHGSTNKTSSSKDETSSLASLVDDAGFDFLTNPKPEVITKPTQSEASTFWSSTSKTPKISNVTSTTLQAEVLGKPNHGNTSNPPIPQFNAAKNTSGKPHQPTIKPMPPPKLYANLPPKSTPQHSVRSFHKRGQDPSGKSRAKISSLDTIVEGTPEQERESPPSDTMPSNEVEKESESLSFLQSGGSYPHEVQKVHGPPEGEQQSKQLNDDASAHTSDMDESSDDDLMNLTLSPPKIDNTTESDLQLNQSDLPHIKGKPPRPSNVQPRFNPGKQPALSTRFIDQDKEASIAPNHCHTPRASQSEVKQSTPYPAESLLMPPPKPPEKRCRLTKLETSRQLVSGHSFQGANSNRKEHAPPLVNENEAVDITSTHQHKDPNRRSHSNVESMVTEKTADERSNKKQSISDVDLDVSGDEKIDRVKISTNNHPKNHGIAKASVGDGRIEDESHPEISLKDPSRKRTQTTTQAESMKQDKAAETQNPKLIVHGHHLPAQTSFPQSRPNVSQNLSNGIRQVKSASKSGEERNEFMQQAEGNDEMGLPTSHHVEIHQKTKRIASEHNNQDNEPRNKHQRLAIDRPQSGSRQFDALKSDDNALNEEMKPNKTEVTQADITNSVPQIKTDAPVNRQGNHIPAGRDGAMPDNAVRQANTKRTSVEPLDKEVWRAMMASTRESKENTSGFLGMVIETPAQRGDQYDSQSVDGSELTQDTIFLIDRVKNSHLNQSRHIQTTSPTCTTSKNPHDVQREHNWKTLQSTFKNEKHDAGAIPHRTVVAKAEIYTKNSEADQHSQTKQGLLSPGTVVPTTQNTPAIKRSNVNEKSHGSTKNPYASIPNSAVQFSTPFPTISTSAPAGLVTSASTAGRQMHHILHDDVYTELLSTATKTAETKRPQPALWTSEIAGSKVKALGVNAAPIFRLGPGKYFRHAPLPPGWTIAVSRSHNIPFYIHPDFGATFYSPVPLPSSDGEVQGTTLLYQADTPEYRQPEHAVSKSQAASTPIIFGLTKSFGSNDTTSSGATHRYENIIKETPIGALIVATNDQFSEMIPGENKNKGLHEHLQVLPIETPLLIDQQFVVSSPKNESESRHEGDSTDSMTTVTIVSSHKLQKDSIPTEIEIINHENAADDEKFQMHLDATAEQAEYERNVTSITLPETTPGKNRYNVVPENKSAHNNDSKSSASIDSNDASLDWAAGISMDSSSSETLTHAEDVIVLHRNRSNATTPRTLSNNNIEQSSSKNFRQSIGSQESDYISFAVDNYDHSPSIPQRVIVGIDNDGDDVSRLQCTPLQQEHTTTISSRFKPAPLSAHHAETISALINNSDKIDGFFEEHSHHSVTSRSYASAQSGLSIASRRSLHPLLPLCSLQNLQFDKARKESEKKRKKKPKRKQAKRQRTVQTIPISA